MVRKGMKTFGVRWIRKDNNRNGGRIDVDRNFDVGTV